MPSSTDFPSDVNTNNLPFRLLAAKVDYARAEKDPHYQAFLFEYHDVLALVVSLETNDNQSSIDKWRDIYNEYTATTGDNAVSEGGIGEVYVFGGEYQRGSQGYLDLTETDKTSGTLLGTKLGHAVMKALPGSEGEIRRATTFNITEGHYLWEGEAVNERRVLSLLTSESNRPELFRWSVWNGRERPADFARYLMHASKIRYTQRVFERDIQRLRSKHESMDHALRQLVTARRHMNAREFIPSESLSITQAKLDRLQENSQNLLYNISYLKEMKLTVQIAERNIKRLVPTAALSSETSAHSPLMLDLAKSEWLREQANIDLGYLEALRERVEESHKIMSYHFRLAEQKNARKLNDLFLLQGAIVGALVVALAAIQAFQARLPLPEEIWWPVIVLLTVLALALPLLSARWHEGLRRVDLISGGLLGSALAWLGINLWPIYFPQLCKAVSHRVWLAYELIVLAAGFLITYFVLSLLNHSWRPGQTPSPQTGNDQAESP